MSEALLVNKLSQARGEIVTLREQNADMLAALEHVYNYLKAPAPSARMQMLLLVERAIAKAKGTE